MEHFQVVIIGAGMAGLGAATKLEELGIRNYKILEAQSQAGGRIKTIICDSKPLELGAQWLHGKHNVLYEIASENNLLSECTSEEGAGIYVRSDGSVIDDLLVQKVDFKVGQILKDCTEFLLHELYPKSVGHFLKEKFMQYLKDSESDPDINKLKLELFDWHLRFQAIDNSCPAMEKVSAKSWGTYECPDDIAHYNFTKGYSSLVDHLISRLQKNSIRYNSEVTRIDFYNGKSKVFCGDKLVTCDFIINTMPLGVLKAFRGFYPELPAKVARSIQCMGYGCIGKIYLVFDTKWWKEAGFQFVWETEAELNQEEKWLRFITGFDSIHTHQNILLGWVGGDAVQIMEGLEEQVLADQCMKLLKRFLPKYKIPEPIAIFRTSWYSNPWSRGSYCHITPDCDNPEMGIHKLCEPVFVDGVMKMLFAGEAVHPSHYSTTHGAFESGQQQASNLYEYLTNQPNN